MEVDMPMKYAIARILLSAKHANQSNKKNMGDGDDDGMNGNGGE